MCRFAAFLFIFGSLTLGGCAHKSGASAQDPWEPSLADAQRQGASLESLKEGLSLYRSHCGGCHMLYPVEQFTAQQWPNWVDEMQERARLDEAQSATIKNYLVALATRSSGAPNESTVSPNQR